MITVDQHASLAKWTSLSADDGTALEQGYYSLDVRVCPMNGNRRLRPRVCAGGTGDTAWVVLLGHSPTFSAG